MRSWSTRRWVVAGVAALGAGLLLGIPTDLVPNPVFDRMIEAPGWAYPAWIVTSVLAGLLVATYVAQPPVDGDGHSVTSDERRFAAGGLLAVFAVGCPTCNALVVLALGSSGAVTLFQPAQPFLAIAGIGLLGWALRRRLAAADVQSCEVTSSP
ncbi:MAG: hypothetical protein WD011_08435 [Nitriliruptoraceae bacterium]